VAGGRGLAPLINSLVSLPGFVIKIATQDFHPTTHISFSTNHPPPNNIPFVSVVDMNNWVAGKEHETVKQKIWPVHCVQGTKGADLIDELQLENIDIVIQKGLDEGCDMYSSFADAFGNFNSVGRGVSHDLVGLLRARQVSHIFIVGLAGEYCVRDSALDAVKAGFAVCVVEDGTKCVDPEQGWRGACQEFKKAGVKVVRANGPEINKVRSLG
jgi:nicotinamidase-related amidase